MPEEFQIRTVEGKEYIYDKFRKKFVFLSPEEWVRQQFLQYITDVKKYPLSMIAVERGIKIGSLTKRFDVLVYQKGDPWMLVECKCETAVINDWVLSQILAYNSLLKVSYLTVTNGRSIYCFDVKKHEWLHDIPDWEK